MAQKEAARATAVRAKVEQVMKAAIDAELTRASSPASLVADAVPFSRGLVFSKTNPFSRGIFFSRVSAEFERLDDLEREVALDPAILGALAERLTQVRALKDLKGEFRTNTAATKRITERSE